MIAANLLGADVQWKRQRDIHTLPPAAGADSAPKDICEPPPGGAKTLEEGLSVMKLPTFWPSER